MKKKITIHEEFIWLLSLVIMSFSVAVVASSDLGLSMIVAPAYLVSLKFNVLTFGQAEYIVQGILFLVFCLIQKKIKPEYFVSFFSGVVYGFCLDLWQKIPFLNPSVTVPGSQALWVRILLFSGGALITAFAVALCFRTYLYPQVYDFFVKGIAERFHLSETKFKTVYDISFLVLSVVLSLCFFQSIRGIGIGTVFVAFLNGFFIGLFGRLFDQLFEIKPLFSTLKERFPVR